MTRVAAVDLGTNSTRLLVADVEDDRVDEVVRRSVVTRLGEGVDARRRLLPVAVARVRNVLADFRRELEALGAERTLAVATSAVRDAENGEAFLGEIEWSYGFATKLLSGDEEARLTRRGVGGLAAGTLLLDVGGGSTELSTSGFATSLDVGSVRLTERSLAHRPADAGGARGRPRGRRRALAASSTCATRSASPARSASSRRSQERDVLSRADSRAAPRRSSPPCRSPSDDGSRASTPHVRR